jgi:hypothetical protein
VGKEWVRKERGKSGSDRSPLFFVSNPCIVSASYWRAILNRRVEDDKEQSEQHELKRGRPSKKSTLTPREQATQFSLSDLRVRRNKQRGADDPAISRYFQKLR